MKDGILQQLGTPDDIYNRPANTYVATFIGSPTMNLITGKAIAAADGGGFGIQGADLPVASPAHQGSQALLGLRPEHIVFSDAAPWRGEVSVVEPTGADTYVVVKTAAGDVTVRTAPQVRVNPGDRVGLDIQMAHANWFDTQSGVRLG
jgi:multiple sugar transport system ATP-binding protein